MRLGVIGGTGLVNLDLKQQLGERGEVLRQDDVNDDRLRICSAAPVHGADWC